MFQYTSTSKRELYLYPYRAASWVFVLSSCSVYILLVSFRPALFGRVAERPGSVGRVGKYFQLLLLLLLLHQRARHHHHQCNCIQQRGFVNAADRLDETASHVAADSATSRGSPSDGLLKILPLPLLPLVKERDGCSGGERLELTKLLPQRPADR